MDESIEQYEKDLDGIISNINLRMRPWNVDIDAICGIGKDEGGCNKYRTCDKRTHEEGRSIIDKICWAKNETLKWCTYEGAVSKPYGVNCKKHLGIYNDKCPDTPTFKLGKYRNCAFPCPYYGCVTTGEPKRKPSNHSCPYMSPYFNSQFSDLHEYHLLYCYLTSKEFIRCQTNYFQLQMGFFAFIDVHKSTESPDFYYMVKHVLGNCHFYFSKYDESNNSFVWDEEEHLKSVVFQLIREQEFEINHTLDFEKAFRKKFDGGIYFTPDGVISLYCFAYICKRITSGGATEELETDDITLKIDDTERMLIDSLGKYKMKNEYLELYEKYGGKYIDSDKIVSGVSWINLLQLLGFINEDYCSTEKFYRFLDEGLLGELQSFGSERKEIENIREKYKNQRSIDSDALRIIKKVIDTKFKNPSDVQKKCPFSIIPNLCLRAFETTSRSHVGVPILEMNNKEAGFFLGTVKDTNNSEKGEFPSFIWTEKTKKERFLNLAKLIREIGKAETHDPYYSLIFERVAFQKGKIEAILEQKHILIDPSSGPVAGNMIVTQNIKLINALTELFDNWADTKAPILILGGRGTGKELIAKALRYRSKRRDKPYLPLNARAFAQGQEEAELFGHEGGTFAGSIARTGKIMEADQGTLFMDEIGYMDPSLQIALNRVVEQGEIQTTGLKGIKKVDVRFIFGTNAPERVHPDLSDRIRKTIKLPPLQERKEDIPILVKHFITIFCNSHNIPIFELDDKALAELSNFSWPGNVRELEYFLEGIVLNNKQGKAITVDFLTEYAPWQDLKLKQDAQPAVIDINSLEHICKLLSMRNVPQLQKQGLIASNQLNYVNQLNIKTGFSIFDITFGTLWLSFKENHKLKKQFLCDCLNTYHNKLPHICPQLSQRMWKDVLKYMQELISEKPALKFEEVIGKFKHWSSRV